MKVLVRVCIFKLYSVHNIVIILLRISFVLFLFISKWNIWSRLVFFLVYIGGVLVLIIYAALYSSVGGTRFLFICSLVILGTRFTCLSSDWFCRRIGEGIIHQSSSVLLIILILLYSLIVVVGVIKT